MSEFNLQDMSGTGERADPEALVLRVGFDDDAAQGFGTVRSVSNCFMMWVVAKVSIYSGACIL